MKCDLHIHTNLSDGRSTTEQVLLSAIENNVKIISITDHTIFDSYKSLTPYSNLDVITGVEISTLKDDIEYHFTMYNFDINNIQLKEYEKNVKEYDKGKFIEEISLLKEIYNLDIPKEKVDDFISKTGYFDKLRINNFLTELNIVGSPLEAFNKYTKNILEHQRYCISLEELFELEKNTVSVVSLAHPTKYFNNMEDLEKFILYLKNNYNLRVVECINTRANLDQQEHLVEFCNNNGLYISGGSDFHVRIGESEIKRIGYANRDINIEELTIFDILRRNNEK